jgi:hypothetical protein
MQVLSPMFSQDQSDIEESGNTDLPMMTLSTILKSTNNFSDEYKLGKGGFGTVYKVYIRIPYKILNIYLFVWFIVLTTFIKLKNLLGCFSRWKGNCCEKAFKNFSSRCGGIKK